MRLTIEIDGEHKTVEMPEEVAEAVRKLAAKHRISFEQAIAQAVVNQRFLEDEIGSDGELIVKKGDREQHLQFA